MAHGICRTVIAVSWVATKGEWPHAEATSSEIVATDTTGGQPLKATCGRTTGCELGEALPGHEYQVRDIRITSHIISFGIGSVAPVLSSFNMSLPKKVFYKRHSTHGHSD
jgi:hypothetical protein